MNSVKTTPPQRRTQAERKAETVGLLVDACIDCLVELGYAGTTTQAIASRAGVSQGAIFRHFASRQELLIATAEVMSQRFIDQYQVEVEKIRTQYGDEMELALAALSQVTRSNMQVAWFELQMAARTDTLLCDAFRPIFMRNQAENVALAQTLFPGMFDQLPLVAELVQLLIQVFHGQTLDAHMDQDSEKSTRMLAVATLLGKIGVEQLTRQAEKQASSET